MVGWNEGSQAQLWGVGCPGQIFILDEFLSFATNDLLVTLDRALHVEHLVHNLSSSWSSWKLHSLILRGRGRVSKGWWGNCQNYYVAARREKQSRSCRPSITRGWGLDELPQAADRQQHLGYSSPFCLLKVRKISLRIMSTCLLSQWHSVNFCHYK